MDTWIAEAHRIRGISLEQLRDELQLHVRTLNARVVELVNNDYADFVNLSAHLVAIDKRLQAIGAPFENLSSQITVYSLLFSCCTVVNLLLCIVLLKPLGSARVSRGQPPRAVCRARTPRSSFEREGAARAYSRADFAHSRRRTHSERE